MVKKYYQCFTERMLSEAASISESISHAGEKGRNNEQILAEFLRKYQPQRFSVDTGQVIAADGSTSSQTDIIIHDRFNTPALFLGGASVLVPVETTYAVISVKTTLDRTELADAVKQIESVRRLKNEASFQYSRGVVTKIPATEGAVLRPRGLVFAFKTKWKEVKTIESCFREVLEPIDDQFRPNGVCIIDTCMIRRIPHKLETKVYREDAFLHFFIFLLHLIQSMPGWLVDFEKYFESYGGYNREDISQH
jgi:hypothetical protein